MALVKLGKQADADTDKDRAATLRVQAIEAYRKAVDAVVRQAKGRMCWATR